MNNKSIRIFHALARSGGTIVSKCLGCMQGIILLSEIHPITRRYDIYNPLVQSHYWHHIVKKEEFPLLKDYDFVEAIKLIANRCGEQEKTLLIRDWAHFDFFGSPVIKVTPPKEFSANLALNNSFQIKEIALVRHPIDQWLSFENYHFLKGKYSIGSFLESFWHFSKKCTNMDFIKYENFTEDPSKYLMQLAEILQFQFDPAFITKWYRYQKITGDNQLSSRGSALKEIKPLSRRQVSSDILKQFHSNDLYWESIKLLGYPN